MNISVSVSSYRFCSMDYAKALLPHRLILRDTILGPNGLNTPFWAHSAAVIAMLSAVGTISDDCSSTVRCDKGVGL